MPSTSGSHGDLRVLMAGTVAFASPWLTDQNLANALTERGKVLYVEPPISPLTPLRARDRRSRLRAMKSLVRNRTYRRGNLTVTRPLALPPVEHGLSRRLSRPWVRRQLQAGLGDGDRSFDVTVLGRRLPMPASPGVVCHLVKDWTPAGADLVGRSEKDLIDEIRELASCADLVLAISRALQGKLAEYGIRSHVLRHGFHASLASRYDDAQIPADLEALPHPRLVYAGRIDARLDMEMLAVLADRFQSGSLVFIGPSSPRLPDSAATRALFGRANVHRLGSRDRSSLPDYLVNADCLLLPYAEREWSRFGSPLKLWDYLYAGPPLVGSGYTVLGEYPWPLVHFVEDHGRFSEAVERALSEDRRHAAARREFALANTWRHRVDELLELVREVARPSRHP